VFAVSAAVHLLGANPLRAWLDALLTPDATAPAPPVRVVQVSDAAWQKNREVKDPSRRRSAPRADGAASAPKPSKAPEPSPVASPPPPPERTAGQIVETAPSADDRVPEQSRFLAMQNARVEKETVARLDARDPDQKRVAAQLQRGGREQPAPPRSPSSGAARDGQSGAEATEAREAQRKLELKYPDILKRDRLSLGPIPQLDGPGLRERKASEAARGNADRLQLTPGATGAEDVEGREAQRPGAPGGRGDRPLPSIDQLMPTVGTVARISASPSMDHVPDVEEGDGTFLNTREFKYATFFYGVRNAVASHWTGAVRDEYGRRDPTGAVYGARDHSTTLRVVLTPSGELDDVTVATGSGLDFLDRVAVEAFRQAQPFPNPPVGIRDDDGLIRFNFTFVLSAGSGSFKFFR
jgi:TonB family protein